MSPSRRCLSVQREGCEPKFDALLDPGSLISRYHLGPLVGEVGTGRERAGSTGGGRGYRKSTPGLIRAVRTTGYLSCTRSVHRAVGPVGVRARAVPEIHGKAKGSEGGPVASTRPDSEAARQVWENTKRNPRSAGADGRGARKPSNDALGALDMAKGEETVETRVQRGCSRTGAVVEAHFVQARDPSGSKFPPTPY